MLNKVKKSLLEFFFPKFCFGCQKEGNYLCQDCQATLEISKFHQQYSTQNLKDLYFALNYQSPLIKNLIQKFKYEPLVKELAKPLSLLIIEHFQLLDNKPPFFGEGVDEVCLLRSLPSSPPLRFARVNDFILIPVPLEKRRLKWRGFNQAEEIAKELSSFLAIPLISHCLIKTRETIPQVELESLARKENIKGAFSYQHPVLVKGKKILLVDDIYTTGATLEEAARVLKQAGAKEIIGIAVGRAKPEHDKF